MTKQAQTLEDQILATYRQMTSRPGGCVRLADLRTKFSTVARADLDRTLIDMDDERIIQLDPDPDRGGLTSADHAAAIDLVGRALHLMREVHRY